MSSALTTRSITIVGAGHAGLSVVAELNRLGHGPTVVDPRPIGATWDDRYPELRLNTEAALSMVPHHPIPEGMDRWPSSAVWSEYLRSTADRLDFESLELEVSSIERSADGWLLHTPDGAVVSTAVVVATGRHRVPVIPAWPGLETTDIVVEHAADFRRGEDFRGQRVIVVGAGNSGAEVADLIATHAASVTVSIRTRPLFVQREILGVGLTTAGRLAKRLPAPVLDRVGPLLQRMRFGDLSSVGLGPPQTPLSRLANRSGPTVDSGFVAEVKAGRIAVCGEIQRIERTGVVLDAGEGLGADRIVAATGYRTGLEEILDPRLLTDDGWPRWTAPFSVSPGLFFSGFCEASLTAFMPDFARQAVELARLIDDYV